jgi:hypothetical protein
MNPVEQHELTTWKVTAGLMAVALVLAMALIVAITHGG